MIACRIQPSNEGFQSDYRSQSKARYNVSCSLYGYGDYVIPAAGQSGYISTKLHHSLKDA